MSALNSEDFIENVSTASLGFEELETNVYLCFNKQLKLWEQTHRQSVKRNLEGKNPTILWNLLMKVGVSGSSVSAIDSVSRMQTGGTHQMWFGLGMGL